MDWLWILIFGSFVQLNSQPVSIADVNVTLPLRPPISALTSGASIYIDVTSLVPSEQFSLAHSRAWIEKEIPYGCVKARLEGAGAAVKLRFEGGTAFEPQRLYLILVGPNAAVPTRRRFNKLTLTSCVPLRGVDVYWMNYRK